MTIHVHVPAIDKIPCSNYWCSCNVMGYQKKMTVITEWTSHYIIHLLKGLQLSLLQNIFKKINDQYKCKSIWLLLISLYLLLTQTGICCITAEKILDSTAVVCILTNFRNNQCAHMTHTLLWITWNPSISRLGISFCWTVKRHFLLCCNFMFSFVSTSNNLCWICRFYVGEKQKSTLYLWLCIAFMRVPIDTK